MAYNCDSIDIISGSLSITRGRLAELAAGIEYHPEACVLEEADGPAEEVVTPKRIDWYGEGSGSTWDEFLAVLCAFAGSADLVCCFEGGDSYQGLRVRDGRITKHKVVMVLGDPE